MLTAYRLVHPEVLTNHDVPIIGDELSGNRWRYVLSSDDGVADLLSGRAGPGRICYDLAVLTLDVLVGRACQSQPYLYPIQSLLSSLTRCHLQLKHSLMLSTV
jgi:hypothetical protein